MNDVVAFDRLCRTVYVAVKAGVVDCTDAFDLAVAVLKSKPTAQHATELASLSLECRPAERPRIAMLAGSLLAAVSFEPGFAEEPEWLERLNQAMLVVNRDGAATGLTHDCRLRVHDGEPGLNGNAHAESWDGHRGTGQGVFPESGADPVSALVAVAEDTQDAVMHTLWSAWPECPVHRLGVHARAHNEVAVWWCTGADGHVVAAIGEWPAS